MNKFFLGIALWSLFLLLGISTFIWEYVPFFKYIQFPYRWLNITTFAIVFVSAVIFYAQDNYDKMKTKRSLFIVLFFLTCLILDYRYITTAHIFTRQSLTQINSVHWNYEQPIWVNQNNIDKSDDIKQHIVIQEGEGSAEVVAWTSAERVMEIKAMNPITLRIRTFYFPGWKAYLDGIPIQIKTEEGVGAMLIDIPAGKQVLILKFEDTPIRYVSKLISLFSLFFIVMLVFLGGKGVKGKYIKWKK